MSSPRILCVGIGNMGSALAEALLGQPTHPKITIWNRTQERPQIKSLITAGAHFEASLEVALAGNEIIIICLLDYDTIYDAFHRIGNSGSFLTGKTVVNLTNGTPRHAKEAEEWMKARGVAQYFDGAVMVTPQLVGTPHSFLIYSGATEAEFQASLDGLLSPLGASVYTGEKVTSAASNDLAGLAAMYGMFSGAFIGIGLLKRELASSGNSTGKVAPFVDKIVVPLLNALVPYVSLIANGVDEEDWDDHKGNPLGMQLVGVRNILQACREEGVNGAGLESIASMMQKAVDGRGGHGNVAEVANVILQESSSV